MKIGVIMGNWVKVARPQRRGNSILTNSIVNTWFQMIREGCSQSAFISLLNAYHTACHYGAESIGHRIDNSETFCGILVFILSNADDTFRGLLQLSSSNCTKETILELRKSSKWESLKPLIKSYLRSTLFLLDQVTDRDILAFALTRFRASLIFFVAFPSLVQRLMKLAETLDASHPLLSVLRTRQLQRLLHSGSGLPSYSSSWLRRLTPAILSLVSFERPNSSPSSIAAVAWLQHPTDQNLRSYMESIHGRLISFHK